MNDISDYPMPLPIMLVCERNGISFYQCLMETFSITEMVANFDRLYGANLSAKGSKLDLLIDKATGRVDSDMKAFINFVWDYVFTRF